jgi:TolB-like protein/DNA-binding winged helix-turn-helix (wHTH) protein
MSATLQPIYAFGPYRLDPAERVLSREGRDVPIPPKDFETLLLLVQRAGHVVEKEELLRIVWAGLVVEEGNLARRISNLRTLLGDGTEGSTYIQTISRRGYRFVALVRELAREDAALEVESRQTERARAVQAHPIDAPSERVGRLGIVAGLLVAAVLAAAIYWITQRQHAEIAAVPQSGRVMLAVLPFANLTGDATQDYFSDGLTEEMISQLGLLDPERFGVIARTSSMTYKKTEKTVAQIGKELGVDYILESSVRGNADKMRLTVQLIRVRDQTHLWVHEYDQVATNTLEVQTQVMRAVANQLAIILAPGTAVPSKTNQDAYELYLKGRFYWNERSVEGLAKGVDYFQQAIAKDPGFALAYAGLADCYQLQVYFDQLKSADGFPKARAAAVKAVELDDKLAEAHTSLASIKGDFDWDWTGAEAEYKRALELNPNYATAYHWYGDFLAGIGRAEEGGVLIKRAQAIDPLSPVIGVTVGQMYCRAGRCDQGVAEYNRVLDMFPTFLQAKAARAEAYVQLGKPQLAIRELEAPPWSSPQPAVLWGDTLWGYALAASGRNAEALKFAREIELRKAGEHTDYTLAVIYAGLGDKTRAFAKLEAARRSHDYWMASIGGDVKLGSLRADPRYDELLRRMQIPSRP